MLKRYFCGGLVALTLLGGCGESYTTTDTGSGRTTARSATTRVENQPGVTLDTTADSNPQTAHSTVTGEDVGTPSTYGQTLDDGDQVADNSVTNPQAKAVEDRQFVAEAAKGGLKEVQLGRLASEKGSNAEIKEFAKLMVTDHSKANDELKSLASKEGFPLPPADLNSPEHSELSKLSGAQFDKKYAELMVLGHEKTVALFEKESQRGLDEALKDWAAEKLPTLKHHLQMARDVQASMKKK